MHGFHETGRLKSSGRSQRKLLTRVCNFDKGVHAFWISMEQEPVFLNINAQRRRSLIGDGTLHTVCIRCQCDSWKANPLKPAYLLVKTKNGDPTGNRTRATMFGRSQVFFPVFAAFLNCNDNDDVIPGCYTMASVHKIPNKPNWFCFFTDEEGRRRCKTTKTTNKKEAEAVCLSYQKAANKARGGRLTETVARKLIEEVVSDLMESSGAPLKRFTVKEWLDSWLSSREHVTAAGTFERYKGIKESFIQHLGAKANASLMSLRADDVLLYRDTLAKKVSTGTVNVHIKVIRSALAKAVKANVIDANPAVLVETLERSDKHHRRPFKLDEVKRLLAAASQDWKTMIYFGLYMGLRLGDIAKLTWQNVDLARKELSVVTTKTGRPVINPLPAPLVKHLETLPSSDDPKTPICPSLFGKPKLSDEFYALMASIGLVEERTHEGSEDGKGRGARRKQSEITFHSFRHTATSLMKNAGVPEAVVMDIIGHESETISRNYSHLDMETKRAALDKMPDIRPAT